jgi:hypothetical protein
MYKLDRGVLQMSNPYYKLQKCSCGEFYNAWRGNVFFLDFEVCPKCGTSKKKFEPVVVRWVNAPVWYNPLKWFDGYYEESK